MNSDEEVSCNRSADFSFFCNVCDEQIWVENADDVNISHTLHLQTPYHIDIEKRMKRIMISGDEDVDDSEKELPESDADFESNTFESRSAISSSISLGITQNFGRPFVPFQLFFCKLCIVDINDSKSMLKHLDSEKHRRLEKFVKELNTRRELLSLLGFSDKNYGLAECEQINGMYSYFSWLNLKNKTMQCMVCDCLVPASKDTMLAHVRGRKHHEELNSQFITRGNNFSFYCFICNMQSSGQVKLNEHCLGFNHKRAVDLVYKVGYCGIMS